LDLYNTFEFKKERMKLIFGRPNQHGAKLMELRLTSFTGVMSYQLYSLDLTQGLFTDTSATRGNT
jgi:hypothetical protein